MKLSDLLEATVSTSVASYNKPLSTEPIKRTTFTGFLSDKKLCKGCEVIKQFGWSSPYTSHKELKCGFCGNLHKRKVTE